MKHSSRLAIALWGSFSLFQFSGTAAEPGLSAERLQPRSKPGGATLFTALEPKATGVNVVNRMDVNNPLSYLYHSGITCGGVGVGDFDGDGKPDIFFAGALGKNQLFRQVGALGEFKFEDITDQAGPLAGGDAWSTGVSVADVNGDGRLDIFVGNYMKPNRLFLNQGPGPKGEPVTFKDVAAEAGLATVDCSHTGVFFDSMGTGRLDLYLLTNRVEDPNGYPPELQADKHPDGSVTLKPGAEKYYRLWRYDAQNWGTEAVGTPDYLFRNEGNDAQGVPHFRNVTQEAGISGRGDGLSAVAWDYDGDGLLDLYVANDFIVPDKLYHNNGNGTFTDVIAEVLPHVPWFSMGSDVGDVNNDLLPDLMVADMSATSHFKSKTTMGVMGGIDLKRAYFGEPMQIMQNALFLNTGTARFEEAARMFKVASTDWTWAVKLADFDNDGWQDLYFTNGISRHMNDSDNKITTDMLIGKHMFDLFKEGEMRKEKHRSYKNSQHGKFDETSDAWGLGVEGVSYGAAYADLDRDGDLDLITVNLEEPNTIYRNDSQDGHRLLVKLIGKKSNRDGLGATITIRAKSGPQMRQLQPQTGYLSCNEALAHFGLGADERIDELTVRWPGGGMQSFAGVKADQLLTITQPADGGTPVKPPIAVPTVFAKSDALAGSKNKDTGWEGDFVKQILLPHSLSQLGPPLAWADVNGDGFPDYYFGGSAGELGELRINDGKGKFTARWVEAFRADKDCEDQGAVFFDADGDGSPDLFVASGTNEVEKASDTLRCRLYLNDRKGNFTAAPDGALPTAREYASAVAAVDYDRDGRIDLFVGSRTVPGEWPHSGESRLLRNETKDGAVKFTDVTDSIPGLRKVGLVTGAVWSDLDGDGFSDLVISCEWGPVHIFKNTQGKLAENSEAAGTAALTGWWRGVTAADVNHDGQMDLIATNIGLNTKYKQPAADHPALMYNGDFDGTGVRKVLEVKREGETLYPERGRSCSSQAMPFIKEKFPTFKQFAKAILTEVYPEEKLASAEKYSAVEFQSGVFLNDHGHFTFQPFERMAQIAPANGVVVCDFNADGHPDIFLAQNFYGPQIEAPRADGGIGQLLLGDGKGGFHPATARESGVVIVGDMRAAAVADWNGDGRPDVAVTLNNGATAAYTGAVAGRWLRVPAGLPGARVALERKGRPTQVVEIHAGAGYLGQDAGDAWFGLGADTMGGTVRVTLPDGTSAEKSFDGKPGTLQLLRPVQTAAK